jgi:putative pyoverdin transport system ATP-binding/permease protein
MLMNVIFFLLRYSRGLVALAIVAGILGGLSNAALIATINGALSGGTFLSDYLPWVFAGLCVLAPLSRFISQALLVRLSQNAVFEMRMRLSRRILSAPLRKLEELGAHRLLATLTEDIGMISNALTSIPLLCMHTTIFVGCVMYLGWLSRSVLIWVVIFLLVGIGLFQLIVRSGMSFLKKAREEQDSMFKHLRALTDGAKELKLHYLRREAFLTRVLEGTAGLFRRHSIIGSTIYTAAASVTHFLQFALIGLVLFVVPKFMAVSTPVITGYTLILLYMLIPLDVILSMSPVLGRAAVALNKVNSLGLSLTKVTTEDEMDIPLEIERRWHSLELENVTHTYHVEQDDDRFTLGPISLHFEPGEIVFVVGGNGSGKTTLVKLIVCLYVPESGTIRLNGETVTDHNREYCRQHFSVVFSDYFLFDSLLGLGAPNLDDRAREYLDQLLLTRKVQVKDSVLSTTNLSQGQRKRLTLMTAYLENRPIFVFDEWAADQDPQFKEVFYLQILPELKARNKTVIVISHDDHYYHVADRIIKLDFGQIDRSYQTALIPAATGIRPNSDQLM